MKNSYVVAAIGDWNKALFQKSMDPLLGDWHFASSPEELDELLQFGVRPKYIFFIHWRWFVPESITQEIACVCFHMTDLPFGRGGSPLQNLIVRGYKKTKLSALKMTKELDAGPIYLKEDLSLSGAASEIYIRASELSWIMIKKIIQMNPQPQEQVGKVTLFERRKPAQSEIANDLNLDQIYDHIRMLDAEGYPSAYLDKGDLRFFFKNAVKDGGSLSALVTIEKRE